MRILTILSLLLAVLALQALAVDKGNFKTCNQSGFCKRNRKLSDEERQSSYTIAPESLVFTEHGVSADLLNSENGVTFTFQLSLLENNRAHFKINEKSPLKPRYEVQDVVITKPVPTKFQHEISADGKTTITFDSNKLVLQNSPFRLDFFVRDEPVITVNSRGLLNFEHTRTRSPIIADGEENLDEAAQKLEERKNYERENNFWEEDFRGHEDRKPNGPTAVALDFTFPGSKGVYGIPEHASSLALAPTKGPGIDSDPYRLYNLDVFEYELDVPMALYGAIPYLLSHKPGYTTGLLWLNAAETWIDVSKPQGSSSQIDTHWISESGIIDVYVFLGPTPQNVFQQYASLTGTTALPPLFSIAYHQCRWNYVDEADVDKVDLGFDANDIPYDVLWLDIEHTDGKKYFTWDSIKFPNPVKMQDSLAEKKRKMVTIIDPHIKRDHGYYIHNEATEKGLYVKSKEKSDFDGHCWPGSSSWVDFTDPQARDWWASKFALSQYKGSTSNLYTWNDMNEPSVFNGPEVTMPKHNIHHGGWEHRDVHNLYGFYQHMATAEGLKNRNQQRPFVLSRAFFAGSQRYGAIWTGDNHASWKHLKASTPMLLSIGLAGLPFSGADVGGFFGNPSAELLTRWYQAGAFQPFFRGHAHLDTKRREPWLMGEPYTTHIRDAIRARYALLPLWYTVFHQSSIDGSPIIRPLWVEFPTEETTFELEDSFLIGNRLLVKPVTDEGAQTINVYLPGSGEVWYDYTTFKAYPGAYTTSLATPLSKIPVFVRGGSVIPKKERVRRSSSLMANDPYTLLIALDPKGQASGDLYIDDGISFDFEKGSYSWKTISFQNNVIKSQDVGAATNFSDNLAVERIVIVGAKQAPTKVTGPAGEELHFEFSVEEQRLTIKKPGVLATGNWEISLN